MNPVERLREKHPKLNEEQQRWLHEDATATLGRLRQKHPNLKDELEKAHGYAVFPSLGRASLVLGGTYGKGEVFEKGKSVGFASLTQITVGVQVGGQTLSELVFFHDREALERFKGGKAAFAANASAGLIKAAATGTSNPSPFTAHAYSRGGMVLELSLGGQKLSFIPTSSEKGDGKGAMGRLWERGDRGEEAQGAMGRLRERLGRHEDEQGEEAQGGEEGERSQRESRLPSPTLTAGLSALALMAARALRAQAESRSGRPD